MELRSVARLAGAGARGRGGCGGEGGGHAGLRAVGRETDWPGPRGQESRTGDGGAVPAGRDPLRRNAAAGRPATAAAEAGRRDEGVKLKRRQ